MADAGCAITKRDSGNVAPKSRKHQNRELKIEDNCFKIYRRFWLTRAINAR